MIRITICSMPILTSIPDIFSVDFTAPTIPDVNNAVAAEPENFSDGLMQILHDALQLIHPAFMDAVGLCVIFVAAAIIIGLIQNIQDKQEHILQLVGTLTVSSILLRNSQSFIHLGAETVNKISNYSKMLLPVMTAALASQGHFSRSASLYVTTAAFDAVLSTAISTLIIPMLYIYLCMSTAHNALGEPILGKIRDFIKWLAVWMLKIVLYLFTGYVGITGVVSGSTDAIALKVTKIAISGAVPVVGGMLADTSEAVLVSAALAKNAAGVYGLLAFISIIIGPFLKIGIQYLLLKITGAICGAFECKQIVGILKDFTTCLGLLLAMTFTVTMIQMISTVCFIMGAT